MGKSILKYAMIVGFFVTSIACNESKNKAEQKINRITMETGKDNAIFPQGTPGSKEYFTGTVWVTPLLSKDKNNEFSIGNVVFEPGARANWHTHPKGQVQLVTSGNGFYQEEGKQAQPLKKGDVVNIPEHIKHWHGAAAHSQFVHIAITNFKEDRNVDWLEPISEQDYNEVNK